MKNPVDIITLAEMRTWQSGILQAAMTRSLRKLTDEFLADYGLSTMHWYIVGAVSETGSSGMRLTDLADKLGTTLGYLTTAVNSLELRGYIRRLEHDSDSRSKLLIVPADKLKQCQKIEAGLRDLLRSEIYQNISRQELVNYITVLQKLAQDL